MSAEIYQVEIPELNIGRTLKRLREAAGYNMETFGDMMGWSKSTVSKVESEVRGISAEELYRAATILGQPISNFYPEIITEGWEDDRPSIGAYAEDIRDIACALIETEGKLTPDIEEKAKGLFLRTIPQNIYRLLNVSPNQVSIKGTLMRGPHFIPRIEINFIGRRGYNLDWFSIVISFRDGLKHVFLSIVQNTDIRFRVDHEPVEQYEQMDKLKSYCEYVVHEKLPNWEADWPGSLERFEVFLDENGNPPENGALWARGYVPVNAPDAYDVTVNDSVYPNMLPFVIANFDGRGAVVGDTIPEQIVDTTHKHQELFDDEYELLDQIDKDLPHAFKYLGYFIESVENDSFRRWKKEALDAIAEIEHYGSPRPSMDGSLDGSIQRIASSSTGFYSIGRKVIEAHEFKCEIDPQHESFSDRNTGKPYMEISHLIPLTAQKDFKKDLNCEANMICVCPICNRKLVRGDSATVEDMLVPLYYSRRTALKEAGIDITLKQLLQYYEG